MIALVAALPYPDLDPVAVSIFGYQLRWYALAYMAGLWFGWKIAVRLAREPGSALTVERANELPTWVVFGLMGGARIGYVLFYKPQYYLENPSKILAMWHGGMSFHGGLIGIFLAVLLFGRARKIPLGALTDVVVLVAPIGLFFGRVANFVNGELYGRPTDHWIGMVFPKDDEQLPRHPSQLYEAFLEGLCLFVSLWILRRTIAKRFHHGFLSGAFLIGYGCFRSIAEFFRMPDDHLGFIWGPTTMGQLLSVPMIIAGGVVIWRVTRRGGIRP